ncbi:unnamed protein product [Dovyalis caffra]|uniref:Uncharacterized protein n=1 Tax=Dovyalis caffra TaxID=77055 RepID=A0AAV1SQ48_9ROSI|nr:unnamed protein product [Dovyalis caffra]
MGRSWERVLRGVEQDGNNVVRGRKRKFMQTVAEGQWLEGRQIERKQRRREMKAGFRGFSLRNRSTATAQTKGLASKHHHFLRRRMAIITATVKRSR